MNVLPAMITPTTGSAAVDSEAVRLTAVTIVSGDESTALTVNVADSAKEFDVELPKLAAGEYVVEWRALSEDTHVVTGTIRFSIAA